MKYKISIKDWDTLNTKSAPNVSFPRLFALNIHYGFFGKPMKDPFIPPIFSNATNHQGVITHYGQYGEFLEGFYLLKSCRKSNMDDNEVSLGGGKDEDIDKVEDKDKNKFEDKNKDKDENIGSSKSDVNTKPEGVKGIYVNFDRGKNKDKNKAKGKTKDKDKNAGFSKSDVDAKSERGKKSNINFDWDKNPDLDKTFTVKSF